MIDSNSAVVLQIGLIESIVVDWERMLQQPDLDCVLAQPVEKGGDYHLAQPHGLH